MFINLIRGNAGAIDHIAAIGWMPVAGQDPLDPVGQLSDVVTQVGVTFVLSHKPMADSLASHAVHIEGLAILRIDEVCFPVGAIAHRHTHAGAGIRHLVRGSLRIEADDHTQIMQAGDSWFEGASSPVRAVALQTTGVTSFLRAMVVPAGYAGKSTFALMDPADAALPRLQVTHRHLDLPLQLDAG